MGLSLCVARGMDSVVFLSPEPTALDLNGDPPHSPHVEMGSVSPRLVGIPALIQASGQPSGVATLPGYCFSLRPFLFRGLRIFCLFVLNCPFLGIDNAKYFGENNWGQEKEFRRHFIYYIKPGGKADEVLS